MTRENVEAKAQRYLTEGRVIVDVAGPGVFAARVRGSGDVHRVRFGRGAWSCSCPARSVCSHLNAARLIAAPDAAQQPKPHGLSPPVRMPSREAVHRPMPRPREEPAHDRH